MARGRCSLLVLVVWLKRSRRRWRKRRLQLLRPSHLQTSLRNLVQTAGWPKPPLMPRLLNLTRSGLTALTDREPTCQTVKVAPTHSPPASVVRSTDPFIKPADRPASQSAPSSDLPGTNSSAAKHQSTSKSHINQPHSDRPRTSELTGTDPPVLHMQATRTSTEPTRKDSISSLDSDAESELLDSSRHLC